MIDTNSIIQAGQAAQEMKTQLSPWLPALAVAAAWLGREISHFIAWGQSSGEKIIAHGGLIKIIGKIFWNKNP